MERGFSLSRRAARPRLFAPPAASPCQDRVETMTDLVGIGLTDLHALMSAVSGRQRLCIQLRHNVRSVPRGINLGEFRTKVENLRGVVDPGDQDHDRSRGAIGGAD